MSKIHLSILSSLCLFLSCSVIDFERPLYAVEDAVGLNEPVFYHQPSGLYLKHQNDPFTLDNMQAAYDKVVATKGEGGFFQQGGKLSPTLFGSIAM